MISVLLVICIVLMAIGALAVQVYGVVLSFKKHWACGLAAIVVPGFALVIGSAKLLGLDLLK